MASMSLFPFLATQEELVASEERQSAIRERLVQESRDRPPNVLLLPRKTDVVPLRAFVHNFNRTAHRLRAQIGTAPVEAGATVNDHRQVLPHELDISGIVSDLYRVGDAEAERLRIPIRSNARFAWQQILKLHRTNAIFSVLTPWHTYTNMVIEEVFGNQRGAEGGAIFFTMKLKEIQRAQLVFLPPPASQTGPAMDKVAEVNRGRQTPRSIRPPAPNFVIDNGVIIDTLPDGDVLLINVPDIVSDEEAGQLLSEGVGAEDLNEYVISPDFLRDGPPPRPPVPRNIRYTTNDNARAVTFEFLSHDPSLRVKLYDTWLQADQTDSRSPQHRTLADDLSLAERQNRVRGITTTVAPAGGATGDQPRARGDAVYAITYTSLPAEQVEQLALPFPGVVIYDPLIVPNAGINWRIRARSFPITGLPLDGPVSGWYSFTVGVSRFPSGSP